MIVEKQQKSARAAGKPVTIRTMLILTAVFASTAASFGHLWRASSGNGQEIGIFVVTTAMMPLLMLVGAYFTMKIAKGIDK